MIKKIFPLLVFIVFSLITAAQNVAINNSGATANASGILDVSSTTKGVLVPRMDKTQKNAIPTPANALLVYQTGPDSIGFHYYDAPNTRWVFINASGFSTDTTAWKITGNNNITSANFLGTTNDTALRFRIKNISSGILDSTTLNTALGYKSLSNRTSALGNTSLGYLSSQERTKGDFNTALGAETLQKDTSGTLNTAVGWRALRNHVTGSQNTAVGVGALEADSSGNFNTAVGRFSNFLNKRGNYNTSLGYAAGFSADTAYEVVLIGTQAGAFNRVPYLTAVGTNALYHNNIITTGNSREGKENTAVGQLSLFSNALGFKNTAVGYHALTSNIIGYYNVAAPSRNTAIGDSAANGTFGNDNVAVGNHALSKNGSGSQHVAIGSRALFNATGNYPNTAIGYSSMDSATSATANTALGSYSLTALKTGINNTAIGNAAMFESFNGATAISSNTAIGNNALRKTKRNNNTAVGAGTLQNDTTGSNNTAIGMNAMASHVRGNNNTAVGFQSLIFDTIGAQNTSVGAFSMNNHLRGNDNTALGYQSLIFDTIGAQNTSIGSLSMFSHLRGNHNTALGYQALFSDTTGFQNTSIGVFSMNNHKSGNLNTAVGYASLYSNGNSQFNVAIGAYALAEDSTGDNNVAVGYNAGGNVLSNNNTYVGNFAGVGIVTRNTGGANTAIGNGAMQAIRSGSQNVAMGDNALGSDSTGNRNVSIGAGSMDQKVRGDDNVAVGFWAGRLDSVSSNSVYIGRNAGYNNNVDGIVAIGYEALYNNGSAPGINGLYNTAVGTRALRNTKQNNNSTAFGYEALLNDTNAIAGNLAIGAFAATSNTSGFWNAAVGNNALAQNTTGFLNTAIGESALYAHIKNDFNVALGAGALLTDTTGFSNTAIGFHSLINNSSGGENVALGFRTGHNNTIGNRLTLIGDSADVALNNLDNASAIGYKALVGASNSMVLGSINGINSATASTSVAIGTTTPNARLHIRIDGATGGPIHPAPAMIIEDNKDSYIQFTNPTANETGLLSGNAITSIRSALIFRQDSSIRLRSGGNIERLIIDKNGFAAFNKVPANGINVGTLHVTNVATDQDQFGIHNQLGDRWTYFVNNSASPTLEMYFNGAFRGSWANATGIYTPVSDKRYKKDITDFNYGLNTIKALQPYKYSYLDSKPSDHQTVGFMAQDVLKIFPEAVYKNVDKQGKEFYTMDYNSFSVLSIKAIQEQQAQIESQDKKINELQKQNELLIKRLEKLENKQ